MKEFNFDENKEFAFMFDNKKNVLRYAGLEDVKIFQEAMKKESVDETQESINALIRIGADKDVIKKLPVNAIVSLFEEAFGVKK